MKANVTPELIAALNKCDPPARALLHCVPTRIIRVVDVKNDGLTFHVEQFVQRGSVIGPLNAAWQILSTHSGQRPGEALRVAVDAAHKAQKDLIAKVQAMAKLQADAMTKYGKPA